MENRIICNCKKVSLYDVQDALEKSHKFSDVEETFKEVQELTKCSTGCGTCHDKILDAISELMHA